MRYFWQFFYDLLWHFFFTFWLVLSLLKFDRRIFRSRLGLYRICRSKLPLLWFHGSSLGEILTLIPLMKEIRQHLPHQQLLSVSTIRGDYIAQKKSEADHIVYLPLDISYIVRRALFYVKPKLIIILETEIWPNLFWEAEKADIPILLVSGRISPRSFPRYKLARPFFSHVLKHASYLMQSPEDRQRIVAIGAPESQVEIAGNIKFDGLRTELSSEEIQELKKTFPISKPVLVAGSTHSGEEKIILDTYLELLRDFPSLTLILAPRHLKRLKEIQNLLESYKLKYVLRSQISSSMPQIILLDTYGELTKIYYLADIVFVGGTLVPVGGHNLMEPAAFGKAVLFGPYISSCRRQAQILQEKNAAQRANSAEELSLSIKELLQAKEKAEGMGKNAQKIVKENQGALKRCVEKILKFYETL